LRAGNGFAPEFKRSFVQESLTPGSVLYLYCSLATTTKDKYVVLGALDPSPLLLVVNSHIAPFLQRDPRLRACQVRLRSEEYSFLVRDSWINAAEVLNGVCLEEIIEQCVEDVSRLKGELHAGTREQIIAAVRRAHTVSPAHKLAIEKALSRRGR